MKIEQKFICEFCGEKFNTKKACKEHEKQHLARKEYMKKNNFIKIVKCCGTCQFRDKFLCCENMDDLKADDSQVRACSVCDQYKLSEDVSDDINEFYSEDNI